MGFLKHLIKLNNRLESSWQVVDLSARPVSIAAGWYVAEFLVPGNLDHLPRLLVRDINGKERERTLIGAHAGRNRMLFFLPEGELFAYSKSITFQRLARVSGLEARFRTLLICSRYLRDFFGFKALFKMIALQFQAPFERSTSVLRFYAQDVSARAYLENIDTWKRFDGFNKSLLSVMGRGVSVTVLIEDESQREHLEQMLLPPDQIVNVNDPDAVPWSDYVIALQATETLRSPAILMLKRAIKAQKDKPLLIYTDHDYRWPKGHSQEGEAPLSPVFKPQPSRAYLACYNYLGPAVVFARDVVSGRAPKELMQSESVYHLAMNLFSDSTKVLHVAETLFCSHRTKELETPLPNSIKSPWPGIEWQRKDDYNVLVAESTAVNGPAVDLIIPTRDGLTVLQPCIDSILAKTDYENYQIIVVDNGSEKPETFEYFEQIKRNERVRIVSYPGEFNYSAINNFAVGHGSSPYVGLINNDIEVIDGDWLTQMMAWAQQPQVGIVGAKLLFGDGRVQHAGVTIGMGNAAGHIHRLEERDAPGYQLRCLATQNMMAVTAACLITPRKLFEELGGLNENEFKVAYNDIDYCLRVESSGKQIIWTPQAVLYHHESVSRGDDMSDTHIERYFNELQALQRRWKTKGFVDKYYNPHLRISDEGVYPQVERESNDELVLCE